MDVSLIEEDLARQATAAVPIWRLTAVTALAAICTVRGSMPHAWRRLVVEGRDTFSLMT